MCHLKFLNVLSQLITQPAIRSCDLIQGSKRGSKNDAPRSNKSSKNESSRRVGGSAMLMEKLDVIRSRNSWDLIACAFGYISLYYVKYIHNEPYITSFQMREKWMEELLDGHEKHCSNMFRMTQSTFHQLCMDLKRKEPPIKMSKSEFKEVLDAMDGLSRDIIRPRDLEFKEIPSQIANDTKYMPHFKDCIGAIDGTHIDVIIRKENQLCYRGRKGTPTINVLAACDFDLFFTYVLIGWERLAYDSRIFLNIIWNPSLNILKPPLSKFLHFS
uniref:DUF8040 domain-containing protein n=1 Tax=Gossypium raimondii TaxID=29730 RepID=A0A0D2PCG7_GOSRA|nr:hypothetical protein B456_007G206400 [Gossypium raimondii]